MIKFSHPGDILREEYLKPSNLKAVDLARATGLSTGRISELLNGKRDITAEIAYRLQQATKISAQLWLNLQNDYDLFMIEKKKAKTIQRQIHPLNLSSLVTAE
jgi:antitoxin HigA-1